MIISLNGNNELTPPNSSALVVLSLHTNTPFALHDSLSSTNMP